MVKPLRWSPSLFASKREESLSSSARTAQGKRTVLNVISRIVRPTSGEVCFSGNRIDHMEAFRIARAGIVHVPEGRRLFPYLSVADNLRIGARKGATDAKRQIEEVFHSFPALRGKRNQKAQSLRGGQQQILALARALMANPKLLILDEPCLGLAPVVIEELYTIIRRVNESGVTVLLAEPNLSLAMRLGTHGYVLEVGKVILEGSMDVLRNNEMVSTAYLGE
jgi:branched-chain amino acid transport system ATP-binding protein